MRIAVVYASRTGNTRRAAENIGTIVAKKGHDVSVRSVDNLDYKELAEADLVIVGTWVSGHFVIAQKPGDARRLTQIPRLTGKKVALFMTYALNPGPALRRMEKLFEGQGAEVVGGFAWNRRKTEEGVTAYVDAVLSAVAAPGSLSVPDPASDEGDVRQHVKNMLAATPPSWRPLTDDDETPGWFERALDRAPGQHEVLVDGCPINYLSWGPEGAPGLLFVHGGGAHAHWWSFLVPLLADTYRIAAIDLSGHGDSGRRPDYQLHHWTDECMAVIDDAHMAPEPVVVGHSMGGFVTIGTAAVHGDRLGGAIILDSPVSAPDPELEAARTGKIFGRLKVYSSIDDALARFRTVPAQDHYVPYVVDHVARHSLRPVDGGVSWKYDPEIFVPPRSLSRELLPQVSCRVALFRSENGLVTPDIGQYMYDLLGRVAPVVEIPEAGHHLMLDQPLLLLTALRTLLADWEHSAPLRTS